MSDLDAEDVVITSDPRRLEGIVANLVGNALEHGGDGVAVRVGREGNGAFVEVADEGPGIAPEHLPHLFERFYKADPARSSGGTGLGLAIAQENARLLGGRIEVWSAARPGRSFHASTVTEPLHAGDRSVSRGEHDGWALLERATRSPRQQWRKESLVKTALIVASLVVLGGSLGVIFASSREPEAAVSLGPAPKPNPIASTTGSDTTLPAPASLEVWFARGEKLVSVRRTHEATPRVATAAIEALLEGPTPAEDASGIHSAIPDGTRLLGISIDRRGRDDRPDLGVPVRRRLPLDAGPPRPGRLHADSVPHRAEGQLQARRHAGERLLERGHRPLASGRPRRLQGSPPGDRRLPAGRGSRVTSPVTVSGSANVFEANVTVKVLDAEGQVVGSTFTTATCGTGCRGTYSVDVRFRTAREQRGTIVVSDDDAAGVGKPPHEVRVPVVLVPPS